MNLTKTILERVTKRIDGKGDFIEIHFENDENHLFQILATRLYDHDKTLVPVEVASWDDGEREFVSIVDKFENWGELMQLARDIRHHRDIKSSLEEDDMEEKNPDESINLMLSQNKNEKKGT